MNESAYTEPIDSTEEIMRMVREETVLRPARRAAAFAALVMAISTVGWVVDRNSADSATTGGPVASDFVRAEIAAHSVLVDADAQTSALTNR